jgi:hypothetical protein
MSIDGLKWQSIRSWAVYEMGVAKRARDEGKNKDVRLQGEAICNTLSALIENMRQRDEKWGGTPSVAAAAAPDGDAGEEKP